MSSLRDLPKLLAQFGIKCKIVSQSRWQNDESEMLLLIFPDGEKWYIKPEFSINDNCWLEVGIFAEVNHDFVPDAKEPN